MGVVVVVVVVVEEEEEVVKEIEPDSGANHVIHLPYSSKYINDTCVGPLGPKVYEWDLL